MFCRNCQQELDHRAIACTRCGVDPLGGVRYCQACGAPTDTQDSHCTSCGVVLARARARTAGAGSDKKLAAGLTALLLSGLGVHKFILGYNTEGLIMLLVTVLTCGIGWLVMGPISIIEGIIYLTKTDEEFVATYVDSYKGWF